MTRDEQIELTLDRAEKALESRTIQDLALAEASLIGALDWAARGADAELVKNVLKTVSDELKAQRNG